MCAWESNVWLSRPSEFLRTCQPISIFDVFERVRAAGLLEPATRFIFLAARRRICNNITMFILAALLLILQPPEPTLAEIVPRLQNQDIKIRLQAITALANWKTELEPKAIVAIAKVMDDPDPKVRKAAIQTLGEIGPRAREWAGGPKFSAQLAKAFQDKDTLTRRAAVWAYGQVGIDSFDELQPLYDSFKDPSADFRGLAVTSAAQYIHEQVKPESRVIVLDKIADALADKDARVQRLTGEILLKGGSDSVPGLKRIVDTGVGPGRLWAALVLGEIGPAARDAIPSLQKAFNEVPKDGKTVIQTALKKIGQ